MEYVDKLEQQEVLAQQPETDAAVVEPLEVPENLLLLRALSATAPNGMPAIVQLPPRYNRNSPRRF